ncbi:DNA-processing protein DprA [Paenibacillus lutimineralis]|uniref:DNA-processing protein DprA n=1 Tax=Paenibacillus lutimineralis TaxID=2707005 RepID=UPI002696E0B5
MVDKNEVLIALHEVNGLGWRRIEEIVKRDAGWVQAYQFSASDWMERGLEAELALWMTQQFTLNWIEERLERMARKRIRPVTIYHEKYPLLMKETVRPPWVLYTIGDMKLLSALSVAIVGTRIPTAYGRKVAAGLTKGLCDRGITVVSGMARGIDGVCHEAALNCGGRTIAVLGTAIDIAYPPEHNSLYRRIAESGLIISEYPIGMKGHPGMFPQRNRIIAGISRGTVVVEADARSGSLITADAALEEDRDVFAVPGPITSPKSRGTLELLKQGAKMVTDVNDILEEYQAFLSYSRVTSEKISEVCELTDEEQRIYDMLQQGINHFDDLLLQTSWDFGLLHSVLLSLIMKKAAVQLPGSVYKII